MKMTFIIPVYNVEQYLEQCIQSILDAWKKEKEILLITGNSTDKSNSICEQYNQSFKEIVVSYQNGKGLSNARNCGLKKATGDYVMFIDSDDYVNSDALQKRLDMIEKSEKEIDVLVSDYFAIGAMERPLKKSQQIAETEKIQNGREYTKKFFCASGSIWNVWRYIYRTEFLLNNHITFLENTKSEDVFFTIQVFLKANRIAYFHFPYYCYRVRREGALTTQINDSHVWDFLNILKNSMEEINNSTDKKMAGYLREKLQREYILNLPLAYEADIQKRKETIRYYQKYVWILKDSRKKRYQFFYWWIYFFGAYMPAFILYKIRKVWRRKSGIYKKFP